MNRPFAQRLEEAITTYRSQSPFIRFRKRVVVFVGPGSPSVLDELKEQLPADAFMLYLYIGKPALPPQPFPRFFTQVVDHTEQYLDALRIFITSLGNLTINLSVVSEIETIHKEFLTRIRRQVENARSLLRQSHRSRLVYLRNSILNLPQIITTGRLFPRMKLEKRSAVICSAGPSLHDALPTLKSHANTTWVVAVGRVADTLSNHGIIPDFIIDVDFQSDLIWNAAALSEIDSIFVSVPSGSPVVSEGFANSLWGIGGSAMFNEWALNNGIPLEPLCLSRTVTVSAVDLAARLGCQNIALVGSDLCFNDSGSYHAGQSQHDIVAEKVMEVPGNETNTVRTDGQLFGLKEALEDYLKMLKNQHPAVNVHNCGKEGAKIAYTHRTTLQAFCESHQMVDKKIILDELNLNAQLAEKIFQTAMEMERYSILLDESRREFDKLSRLVISNTAPSTTEIDEIISKAALDKASPDIRAFAIEMEHQVDDYLNMTPYPHEYLKDNPKDQIDYWTEKLNLKSELWSDITADWQSSARKLTGQSAEERDGRFFESFFRFGVRFIRNGNRELGDLLLDMWETGFERHYTFTSNLQYLPFTIKNRDGDVVVSRTAADATSWAMKQARTFAEDHSFDPAGQAACFVISTNWEVVVEFAILHPTADIIVVTPDLNLLACLLERSMFLHLLPKKTLIVGADKQLRRWEHVLKRAVQKIGKTEKKVIPYVEDFDTTKSCWQQIQNMLKA